MDHGGEVSSSEADPLSSGGGDEQSPSVSLLQGVDENTEQQQQERDPDDDSFLNFISTFVQSKSGLHILVIISILSIGFGSTVGIVPDVMANRYASLHHGYNTTTNGDCSNFDRIDKPKACILGEDDSQQAAAISNMVKNILTLLCMSTIGSLSDKYGRRPVLILSVFLSMLSPFALLLMQVYDTTIDPFWYYALDSSIGIVNIMAASFTALSDVIPHNYRAASFGLVTGFFFLFFSCAPSLIINHEEAVIFSFAFMVIAFLYSLLLLPETLPSRIARHNMIRDESNQPSTTTTTTIVHSQQQQQTRCVSKSSVLSFLIRPIREMSILNRSYTLRIIAIGSFTSGMVFATDATLFLYYVENQLNVRDRDLAKMFLTMGFTGVLIQVVLLKFLISWLGEKRLVVVTFCSGTIHNLCYGLAQTQGLIYVALSLSQLTKVNYPLLSSIASSQVNEFEQGRLQGALFALSALANAIGPMVLQYVYRRQTIQNNDDAGFMFVLAAGLYFVGTVFVTFLPPTDRRIDSHEEMDEATQAGVEEENASNDLEEPLLS